MVGLKKRIPDAKISPKMVNPNDVAGNMGKEEGGVLKKKVVY